MWDDLWLGATVATMQGDGLGLIEEGAVAAKDGRIAFAGPAGSLPGPALSLARRVHDVSGTLMTPGLVDCHTHLVFGGDRIAEFRLSLAGATRAEIAASGGGIVATMRATRAASEAQLLEGARGRLRCLMAEGVTTVEIKSGYGLDRETELRMLRVARRLGREEGIRVVTSFLGAHALPPEYTGRPDDYLDFLAEDVLPAAHAEALVDMCDGGIEGLSIPREAMLRLYAKATALGLPLRGHTDQYRDVGGAAAYAALGARSADHLEYANEAGIEAMGRAGTTAVLLPGSTLFLRETERPPVALFRKHGVRMAIATNCNPGSSPTRSPLLVLALAATMFRLTPEEALRGYTAEAARVLARENEVGTIAEGFAADLAIWNVKDLAELCYWLGGNPLRAVVRGGITA
ncbi:imidazolonepropionase [Elioraea rosea]|uniref:imidazolonepropionase n=1 Tax=Elioraea rosea TaxID=2492390 RepID=UPI001182186B|nr:imidazolonepropionase [Elioraea rosea]